MDNPPVLQLWCFTLSIVFGGIWAVFYGVCGILRIGAGLKRLFFADAFFWFISLPTLALFLFFLNGGDIRGYVLTGIGGGFLIVTLTFGGIFSRIVRLWAARTRKKAGKNSQN